MIKYVVESNKISSKSGKRIISIGKVVVKNNRDRVSDVLTFWVDANDVKFNVPEDSYVYPEFRIMQDGFNFKVYLNSLVIAK